jgi:diadenosine tetraphosphate (Ap4A) HIT family hydrolase
MIYLQGTGTAQQLSTSARYSYTLLICIHTQPSLMRSAQTSRHAWSSCNPIMETRSRCPFCAIGLHYPPSTTPNPKHDLVSPPAFVVLSTPLCLAFLDIMPLSPGHLLVTTRRHREKISEVTEDESRELGLWLPRLSRVLANVTDVHDWNIVQNNGMRDPLHLLPV